jgi:hypothetical protein
LVVDAKGQNWDLLRLCGRWEESNIWSAASEWWLMQRTELGFYLGFVGELKESNV